jgi:hypothetical protein
MRNLFLTSGDELFFIIEFEEQLTTHAKQLAITQNLLQRSRF